MGRSFYVLDDVNPLRQYGTNVTSTSDAYLFKPGDAIRTAGPARITYWLKRQPTGSLKLEILDGKGQVIRSFDGALPGRGRGAEAAGRAEEAGRAGAADQGRGREGEAEHGRGAGGAQQARGAAEGEPGQGRGAEGEAALEEGGGRGGAPTTAPMAAGLQRFNWDVQFQPVVNFPGMVLWGATQSGPTALPGTYQVRLTVDGRSQTQSFAVLKHPWHTASDADLQAQFDFASQIRDKVNEANNAVIQIRRLKQQLADRVTKTSNADAKAIAEEFTRQLTAVEVDLYQVRNQSNQDPLNFPIRTNNRLASLLRVVLAGDGKPTANTGPIFDDLKAELKGEADRLQVAISTYLPRFNQLAQRIGMEPIAEK
jgi:hypothetical protein